MSLRLSEFYLASYKERQVLILALSYYKIHAPDMYPEAVEALELRLTHTVCQPGGCTYCTDPDYPRED